MASDDLSVEAAIAVRVWREALRSVLPVGVLLSPSRPWDGARRSETERRWATSMMQDPDI